VGTVWLAAALRGGKINAKMFNFKGARNEIRLYAACAVLEEIFKILSIKG